MLVEQKCVTQKMHKTDLCFLDSIDSGQVAPSMVRNANNGHHINVDHFVGNIVLVAHLFIVLEVAEGGEIVR